jgi:HlyD family secretion protein
MKKFIILSLIVAVIIGVPVFKQMNKGSNSKNVEVEAVALQTIKASILASGQLKHQLEVKLSAEVIGKVTQLLVEEGDKVSKGQLVLTIDDQTYVAAVEQQQAVVDQQKIAIERQKLVVANMKSKLNRKAKLYQQNLLDKDAYELVNHQYEVAQVDLKSGYEMLKQVEAQLEQAKDRLSKTRVLSPIDGQITSLDIKQGETAISGTTNISGSSLMTIADPMSMLAEINVDEADIANVKIGQTAEIIAIAFADQPLTGTIVSIASSAKAAPGRQNLSFAVKLKLDVSDSSESTANSLQPQNLRPGMSCRAEVFTQGQQQLLAVPLNALKTFEDNDSSVIQNYVYVLSDDESKVEKVNIETGISDDNYQQVLKGLKLGTKIVTGPAKILRRLNDGDQVSVVKLERPAKAAKSGQ